MQSKVANLFAKESISACERQTDQGKACSSFWNAQSKFWFAIILL